jgi:hypothetical protein
MDFDQRSRITPSLRGGETLVKPGSIMGFTSLELSRYLKGERSNGKASTATMARKGLSLLAPSVIGL